MSSDEGVPLKDFDDHDYACDASVVWDQIQETQRRNRASKASVSRLSRLAAAVVLGCIVAGPAYGLWRSVGPEPLRLANGEALPSGWIAVGEQEEVALSDGSVLHLGPGSQVRVLINDAEHIELLQRAGEVTYEVGQRGRLWRVDAGLASVEVFGKRFTIRRAGEVHVRADEGRVLVRSTLFDDGVVLLTPGDDVHLPSRRQDAVSVPLDPEALLAPVSRVAHAGTASAVLLERARTLKQGGQGPEAAVLLHLVVERSDASSAEAAYVLGELHKEERPELAVHDFAVAIRLGIGEPLRRQAFVGRLEAASLAGLPTEEFEASVRENYPGVSFAP